MGEADEPTTQTVSDSPLLPWGEIGAFLVKRDWVIGVALVALAFLLVAIARLPGDPMPPWAFAPLLAAAVLWALVCLDAPVAPQPAWTAALVVWLSVAAIVEPVLANVRPLDFR